MNTRYELHSDAGRFDFDNEKSAIDNAWSLAHSIWDVPAKYLFDNGGQYIIAFDENQLAGIVPRIFVLKIEDEVKEPTKPTQPTEQFTLAHILSVYTGILVLEDGQDFGIVYEILDYMTNDNLYTLALGPAAEECKPYLAEQFKWLTDINSNGIGKNEWKAWYQGLVTQYGQFHDVRPIHAEDHEVVDPIEQIKRIRPDAKIIKVDPDDFK